MQIRSFHIDDTAAVIALWHAASLTRPWNDPQKDIDRKLLVQPELFLVGELDGRIIATAMGGYDGHRGSLYYLAVDPAEQGNGHGAAILAHLQTLLTTMGCPKINLMVRTGNEAVASFYARQGYEVQATTVHGKRLIED